jgi:protein-tyrosine kinase
MSRIHEALKKAEQERAASQGGAMQSGIVSTPVADSPLSPEVTAHLPGGADAGLSAAGVSAFGPTANPDTLLSRCPQMEWKPNQETMLFLNGDDNARGTEEYRRLRSRLYHLREKMNLKTMLVTSALPGEGKSFTASNLAQVLVRQQGRRVLLIDGDLRGPRLHQMLGTTVDPGLSDYLQGRYDDFSIMQRGPMENLFFIPSGSEIDDPSELVGNGKLKTLIQRVSSLFDWIIIDSPPAIPVSDASLLAKACDGVLMVVRSNVTPADAARRARLEFPEESLIGVVLNATHSEATPYERYYYETYEKNGNSAKS